MIGSHDLMNNLILSARPQLHWFGGREYMSLVRAYLTAHAYFQGSIINMTSPHLMLFFVAVTEFDLFR